MKKRMFITIAAMLFGVSAFAQQPEEVKVPKHEMPTVEQIAKHKADQLKQQLLLGQEQYEQVYKLCLVQAEKDMARMKEQKAEKEQMAAKMKGILNDAQYERFIKLQKAPHPQRPQRPGFPKHPGPRYETCDEPMACPQGVACDKAECDKCNAEKQCCDKKAECGEKMGDAPKMKAKESAEAPKFKKGERMRLPAADRRHNKNAYNYIDEGAAEN